MDSDVMCAELSSEQHSKGKPSQDERQGEAAQAERDHAALPFAARRAIPATPSAYPSRYATASLASSATSQLPVCICTQYDPSGERRNLGDLRNVASPRP